MSKPKHEHKIDLHDSLCLVKIDWFTFMAKRVLPHGFWGPATANADDRHLYLTFDDGPHPATTIPLLDLLEEEGVTATFFVMGARTARHQELVAEMSRRGHAVGNHSLNHPYLPALTTRALEKEIGATSEYIKEATGAEPQLFRPPFGLLDRRGAAVVKEREMQTVYWGAVSEDWLGIGEKRVITRTMHRLAHGRLIVLHEGRRIAKQTLAATREIIKLSKAQGYSFESIDWLGHI